LNSGVEHSISAAAQPLVPVPAVPFPVVPGVPCCADHLLLRLLLGLLIELVDLRCIQLLSRRQYVINCLNGVDSLLGLRLSDRRGGAWGSFRISPEHPSLWRLSRPACTACLDGLLGCLQGSTRQPLEPAVRQLRGLSLLCVGGAGSLGCRSKPVALATACDQCRLLTTPTGLVGRYCLLHGGGHCGDRRRR
jgi:hypothetical protein